MLAVATLERPLCGAGLPLPRMPYVVFLSAPDLPSGFQSGSAAFSKPFGLWAGRVKLVVLWGEPLVANAEETLRNSALVGCGRSSSLRSFESFEESGRRSRLHRDVVQGRVSSVDMTIIIMIGAYEMDGCGRGVGGRICCAVLLGCCRREVHCLFVVGGRR